MIAAIEGVIADEPVLVTGLVSAVLILLMAFGVSLSDAQGKAVLGLVAAFLMLAGSVIARSRVTPTGKVDDLVAAASANAIAPHV